MGSREKDVTGLVLGKMVTAKGFQLSQYVFLVPLLQVPRTALACSHVVSETALLQTLLPSLFYLFSPQPVGREAKTLA